MPSSLKTETPLILTCGEPAGVGLEIAQKAFEQLRGELSFALIADRRHVVGPVQEVSALDEVPATPDALPLLHHEFAGDATPGAPDPRNAQGVIDVIARAVTLTTTGQASAICTAPIHKKALKDGADFPFPGHTELLAHLAEVEDVVMMLACDALKVVPATIHIPLSEVPSALTEAHLEQVIRITHAGLVAQFGLPAPRIAVAGLNPHAGEGGAMGTEDDALIAPLLARLSGEGFALSGPLPADTMFHPEARARYDAAICMYHDQALIPIKTLDFARGVNCTLGLPFIRTSPDHGTAFDIAGQGIADPSSTIAALRLAREMATEKAQA